MASKRIPGSIKKVLTSQPAQPASPSPPVHVKADLDEENALKKELDNLKIAIREKEKQRAASNQGSKNSLQDLCEQTASEAEIALAAVNKLQQDITQHKEKVDCDELQVKIATLNAETADLRSTLATGAVAATQSIAHLTRPEQWTSEGKTLSRLERTIATNEASLNSARDKRDALIKDINDLKTVRAEKQSAHEKGEEDIKSAEQKLVALIQKAEAAAEVDERLLKEKKATAISIEKDAAAAKTLLEMAEGEVEALTSRLEQIKRHPNANASFTPDTGSQNRKKELKTAYEAAKLYLGKRATYSGTLHQDTAQARAANDAELSDRAKTISSARAMHRKRQEQAFRTISDIISSAPNGYEVPIEEAKLSILADTINGESLLKLDPTSLAVLLETAKACTDVPELHQQSAIDNVNHETSKTRALQIKLQSLQAKAEHDGRATPARGMSMSGQSDATGAPGERLGELETKFARIDAIAKLLATRHQQLVTTLSEVQAQSAEMELALL